MRKKRNSREYRRLYCEYHGLKEIPKGHHVHHKNGKFWDNRKENLILLTAKQHASLHAKHRRKYKATVQQSSWFNRF